MTSLNSPIKVMIITDDNAMTEILKSVLDTKDFRTFFTNSNFEGITAVHRYDPEVIIFDLVEPNKDGLSICREIRSFSNVPILMLSAVSKTGMLELALNSGADEYLIKPVPIKILKAHLNTLARRSREEKKAETLLNVGSLTNSDTQPRLV